MKICEKKIQEIWPKLGKDLELKIGYRAGWKDALEWVKIQVCPEAWDVLDVEDFIEEELEDK